MEVAIQETVDQRVRPIRLTVLLQLSTDGIAYFTSQGRNPTRFELADGRVAYGLQVRDFAPPTIQKMILLGYVESIELSLNDVVKHRPDLIDLTKLITYGVLYRQFGTLVFDLLVNSDLVKQWNRSNPRSPIDFKTRVNRKHLSMLLAKHAQEVTVFERDVLSGVRGWLEHKRELPADERRMQELLSHRYVQNMRPISRFLLATHRDSPSYRPIIGRTRDILHAYLEKASVAEYLALLVMEILTPLHRRLRDRGDESPLQLMWRISRPKEVAGDRAKLHLIISNNAVKFEELKSKVNLRIGADVRGKTLYDFYTGQTGGEFALDLGLYYLSFLQEVCRKLNIMFDSYVSRAGSDDQVLVNIVITF